MIPLCCASREFALVDSPWLNGISSPQFPQAWPVVGRVNGFVCARTGIRHYEYVQSRLWSSSTCSRQNPQKKNSWHVRVVSGLQARTAIRSRAAIASFRHCFGREDMQILRLDVESSLWPARPTSHARMKDDCCQKLKERSFVVTLFGQSHRFTKLRAWKLHRTPKREEWMCRESQIKTFQTVFCPVAEAQG